MDDAKHDCFGHAGDSGFVDGGRRGPPHQLLCQATLAKEITTPQKGDHSFLAPLGHNRELHAAFLDIEDGIRRVTLREDILLVAVLPGRLLRANYFEELSGVGSGATFVNHKFLPESGIIIDIRQPLQGAHAAPPASTWLQAFNQIRQASVAVHTESSPLDRLGPGIVQQLERAQTVRAD